MPMVSLTAAALDAELRGRAMSSGARWTPLGTRCYPATAPCNNRAGSQQQALGAQRGPRPSRRCLLGFGGFLNRCLRGALVPGHVVRKRSGSCH